MSCNARSATTSTSIEEGQNGRTTVFDVPFEPDRNGLTHLPVALQTHHPLEAVGDRPGHERSVPPWGVNAYHVAHGAMKLAEVVLASDAGPADGAPLVLVVVPPPFAPLGQWDQDASPGAEGESQRLSQAFVDTAAAYHEEDGLTIPLLDLRDHVASSPITGPDFEADGHRAIGTAVATRLREMLQPSDGVLRRPVHAIDEVRQRLLRAPDHFLPHRHPEVLGDPARRDVVREDQI